MKLSIVIVNYNVRYFLDQCLRSIDLAEKPSKSEVIVVDNNSSDDSAQMLHEKYPHVRLIANNDNRGFSVACNQGLKESQGEYVLFLNPDTILREDSLSLPLKFMEQYPDIGALGVKMIDGSGEFLPESKRGLPKPFVAFCKASGLSGLFPRSGFFNRYYLGHLSENENHDVEVLCGAYMLMRRSAMEKAGGGFDEDFFMYGEDIDLSYRISLSGYRVFYLADTSIIHFKGESTKKSSLNYIRTFYRAMEIFSEKHFRSSGYLFRWFLRMGIYIKAFLTLVRTFIQGRGLIILDLVIIYMGSVGLRHSLSIFIHGQAGYYPDTMLYFNLPVYAFVWVLFLYIYGFYSKSRTLIQSMVGIFLGGVVLFAIYGMLDSYFRSSRAVLLASGIWVLLYALGSRVLFNLITFRKLRFNFERSGSVLLLGKKTQILKALEILQFNQYKVDQIIPLSVERSDDPYFKGSLEDIEDIAHAWQSNEVIFCDPKMSFSRMMDIMNKLGTRMKYRILTPEGDSLISSYSAARSGELFSRQISHQLSMPHIRLRKRLLDLLVSTFMLPALPILLMVVRKRGKLIKDWLLTILGRKTWVGYHPGYSPSPLQPKVPPACVWQHFEPGADQDLVSRYNYSYSTNYNLYSDLEIFFNNFAYVYNR
ncbi:MAG: glycosyltransferase [Saprospirales bacterium]|nr:MAG: glycosyltransferase [Saprospirales bacterium]